MSNIIRDKNLNPIIIIIIILLALVFSLASIFGESKLFFGSTSAICIIILFSMFWKKLVFYIFPWMVISGVIRKWVLPGQADIVFLFTQLILTGIYLGFFINKLKEKSNNTNNFFSNIGFTNFLHLIFFIWCLLTSLFQRDSIFMLLIGLVIYFYNVPLCFIVSSYKISFGSIVSFLQKIVYFSAPVLILGIIQYFSPPNSTINKYVTELEAIAQVGEYSRVTSTFSYLAGYATFLDLLVLIVLFLISISYFDRNKFYKPFLYVILFLTFINLFMNGSRGALTYGLFTLISYLFIMLFINLKKGRKLIVELSISLALLAIISFTYTKTTETIVMPTIQRFVENDDIGERLNGTLFDALEFVKLTGLSGFGIGSTYMGSTKFSNKPYNLMQISGGYEEEPERIVLEVGIVGLILAFLIRFLLMVNFVTLFFRLKMPELRLLSSLAILFQLKYLLGLAFLFYDMTSSIFFWGITSLLYILPELDKKYLQSKKTTYTKS